MEGVRVLCYIIPLQYTVFHNVESLQRPQQTTLPSQMTNPEPKQHPLQY